MRFISRPANGVIEQHRPIRVAFFEEFEGADTVLIDLDHAGLRDLIACLRELMSTGRTTTLTERDGVGAQPGLRVEMVCTTNDAGMARGSEKQFVWRRSRDGWTGILQKLTAMETGVSHQYLDGPRDDVRVRASIVRTVAEPFSDTKTG